MGRPGSGKSHLAQSLSADLRLAHLDIAAMPGHLVEPIRAWAALAHELEAGPAIVETSGVSSYEETFWEHRRSTVVRCSVSRTVQQARLNQRRQARVEPHYVERMLQIPAPPRGDIEWQGDATVPGPEYEALLTELRTAIAPRELMMVV